MRSVVGEQRKSPEPGPTDGEYIAVKRRVLGVFSLIYGKTPYETLQICANGRRESLIGLPGLKKMVLQLKNGAHTPIIREMGKAVDTSSTKNASDAGMDECGRRLFRNLKLSGVVPPYRSIRNSTYY